jgi:hypothetical protein
MNREEFLMYQNLDNYFQNCLCICDPLEFKTRQRALLLKLSEVVLHPYREYKEQIKPESASSDHTTSQP